jgi:hypothetical protein
MAGPDLTLETAIIDGLRRAGEPVREASLYERVLAAGADVTPDAFLAAVARLETLGRLQLSVEHDRPAHDPLPFQPRYLRIGRDVDAG